MRFLGVCFEVVSDQDPWFTRNFALNTISAQGTGLFLVELVFGCKLHHPKDIVLGNPVV